MKDLYCFSLLSSVYSPSDYRFIHQVIIFMENIFEIVTLPISCIILVFPDIHGRIHLKFLFCQSLAISYILVMFQNSLRGHGGSV